MSGSGTTLDVRVLGDLEVIVDGKPAALGGHKQRALLAALLLERGRPVSVDRLAEAIWAGAAPAASYKNIQVYVSGLRKALGDGRIVTRGRSYELVLAPGEVDIDRFDDLVRAAAGEPPEGSASLLRDALELVRGRPFADVQLELWADREVERIHDRILDATEARIDAELALGRHGDLVPELERLADEHPYRERLLELLISRSTAAGGRPTRWRHIDAALRASGTTSGSIRVARSSSSRRRSCVMTTRSTLPLPLGGVLRRSRNASAAGSSRRPAPLRWSLPLPQRRRSR